MPVILTDEIQLHTGLIVPADTTSTVEFIPADSKNERRVVTLQLVSNEPPATGNGVIFWWVDEKGVEYPAWQVLLDGGEGTDGTNPAKAGMNDTDTVGFQQDEDGNYFFNIPKGVGLKIQAFQTVNTSDTLWVTAEVQIYESV